MTGLTLVFSFPPTPLGVPTNKAGQPICRVLDTLSTREFYDDKPISWNAPTASLESDEADSPETLTARLLSRREDQFLPMGLTGAPHQFLDERESGSELEWAMSNPWNTGCVDRGFARPPLVLIPGYSEPPRVEVPIIVAGPARTGPRNTTGVLAAERNGLSHSLPCVDASAIDQPTAYSTSRAIGRALRRLRRSQPNGYTGLGTVLLATFGDDVSPDRAERLLDAVALLCERGVVQLQPLADPAAWKESGGRVVPWQRLRAADAAVQRAAAEIRRRRSTRLTRRETLEVLANRRSEKAFQPRPAGHRNFDASMMGEVSLSGPSVDALFSGGRFAGLVAPGSREFRPTRSFLRTGSPKPVSLEPLTCFSFESDDVTGLRCVEVVRGGPAKHDVREPDSSRFVSDFSWVSDLPVLVASHMLIPGQDLRGAGVEMLHLTTHLPEAFDLEIEAGFGSQWREPTALSDGDGEREVFGTRFCIRHLDETMCVAFLSTDGLPMVSSVGVYHAPDPILAFGGRFDLTGAVERGRAAGFALLFAVGDEAKSLVNRILSGRLPAAFQRELGNGP